MPFRKAAVYFVAMSSKPFTRLSAPAQASPGLILCGFASLAIWLAGLFVPELFGRALSSLIVRPGPVSLDTGPLWLLLLLFVPYAAAFVVATRRPRPHDGAVIAIFAALSCLALVLRERPMATHDLFLYIFQGRAAALHGLNPYAIVPAGVADPFVAEMGKWLSGLKNTYGPLWTTLAAGIAALVGDRPVALVYAFKIAAAAFFLACIPLVAALRANVAGPSPRPANAGFLLLFAWNPALLFEAVQNGHNDIAMIFFLLLALILAIRGRSGTAGAALAASFLIKYVSVLCVPVFAAYALSRAPRGGRLRALAAFFAPLVLLTVGAFVPYWRGAGASVLDGLAAQSSLVGIDVASPFAFSLAYAYARGTKLIFAQETVDAVTGASFLAFAVATAAVVAFSFLRRLDARDFVRCAFAPIACYLAFACFWFMPWYLAWLAPILAIEEAAAAAFAAAA
ncbi:MAG TPA: hypothetical protein VLC10_04860, partial [Patescibacteria group bacterium]|nr:hypothetical protein [Patescibacteria group bacterium]